MMALQVFVARKTHYYEVFNETMQEFTISIATAGGKSREEAIKEMEPTMKDTKGAIQLNKLCSF